MKRLLVAAASSALILAACGGSSEVAATVNGSELTATDVRGMAFDQDGLTAEIQAQYLGFLVQWTAIEQAAQAEFGITADEVAVDAQLAQLLAGVGQGATMEQFMEAQNVSESGLRMFGAQLVIEELIREELGATVDQPSEAEAQQTLADESAAWTEVCASHILVATQEEAVAARNRLDSGEDFAVVAGEVSLDPGSAAVGGSLGCASPAGYVPEFAEATMTSEIGVVTDPIETEFGFHLILVERRFTPSVEEMQQILHGLAIDDAVNQWFLTAITTADVLVEEQYGSWVTDPFPQIVLNS